MGGDPKKLPLFSPRTWREVPAPPTPDSRLVRLFTNSGGWTAAMWSNNPLTNIQQARQRALQTSQRMEAREVQRLLTLGIPDPPRAPVSNPAMSPEWNKHRSRMWMEEISRWNKVYYSKPRAKM